MITPKGNKQIFMKYLNWWGLIKGTSDQMLGTIGIIFLILKYPKFTTKVPFSIYFQWFWLSGAYFTKGLSPDLDLNLRLWS